MYLTVCQDCALECVSIYESGNDPWIVPGIHVHGCSILYLKAVGLTEGSGLRIALILIYSAGSGVGFYIAKGFFDTVPKSLSEAAILDGCNQFQVFYKIILPLSKPIVVYTILTAFLAPWLDFVFVRVIVGPKDKYWTVSLLLYNMLEKEFVNGWFTRWAAAAVIVSIPISILFVFMQKFYVDGLTGAVKLMMKDRKPVVV